MDGDERRAELIGRIEELQQELRALNLAAKATTRRGARPVRGQILDALDDLGIPTYTREMQQFLGAVTGERIEGTRFSSLRQKERDAYDRPGAGRTVYIGSALTERGEAVKRLQVRSDWPLSERVVASTTGRCQYLRMTERLCTFFIERRSLIADVDAFRLLVADHARDLPGIDFRRDTWEPEKWRDACQDMLSDVLERDSANRSRIALRLGNVLEERDLIFGTEDRVDPEPRLTAPITEENFG